jgi:hypothetical protein
VPTSVTATPAVGLLLVEPGRDEFDEFNDRTLVSHGSDIDAPETTRTIDTPIPPAQALSKRDDSPRTPRSGTHQTVQTTKRERH